MAGKGGVSAQHLQALIHQGMQVHQGGNLQEAEALYRRVLEAEPDHADAHHLLGMIAHQTGNHETAVDLISKAIRANPGFSAFHANLGLVLQALGRNGDAIASLQKAADLNPDHIEALENLANLLKDQGDLEDAATAYAKVLALKPGSAESQKQLADTLHQLGRLQEAADSYQSVLTHAPKSPPILNNLGNVFLELGRMADAAECYQKALAIDPDLYIPHNNLGKALRELGRLDDAVTSCRRSIALNPDYAEAHNNLGIALMDLGQIDDAVSSFLQALKVKPDSAAVLGSLGIAFQRLGKLGDAEDSYRKALTIDPDYPEAHCKLGNVLTDQRKLDEALACYKKTLALMADHPEAAKLYLYTLLYHPDVTNEDLFEAFRQFTQDRRPDQSAPVPAVPLAAGQRLRIGYLSSDFRNHPLGRNIMPLLSHHDHDRFEIFCYAELPGEDDVTAQFRRDADHWRTINGIPDAGVAEKIRDDGIHVMIYLGGHFDSNRPSIATYRPAPVQVSMHGGTTTALEDMDYWLSDGVLHPPLDKGGDTEERFTEEVFRLPNFYVYPQPEDAPPVSPLPVEDNGFITFCSFNKPCKMNDGVLDLWSKVMLAVPGSRLMLKFKNHLETPTLSQGMLGRFEANGIPAARISLISALDNHHDHLAHYHNADIALDTFPFAGATTTFQALWMGLPVISLMGDRFISRAGGSLSTHAGLADLVCEAPQDYVDTAAALAGDLPRLKDLRATLRRRVGASPLCDGPGYAANVEAAYLSMWEAAQASAGTP